MGLSFAKANAAQICASRNACARLAQHKASSKAGSAGLGPQSPQMRTVFVVPPSLPWQVLFVAPGARKRLLGSALGRHRDGQFS